MQPDHFSAASDAWRRAPAEQGDSEQPIAGHPSQIPATRGGATEEWYVRITADASLDERRTTALRSALEPLLELDVLRGSTIEDIECYPRACSVRVRSHSEAAQSMLGPLLVTESGLDETKTLSYDHDSQVTTLYLASDQN